MRRGDRGIALLEAMVALAILAASGASLIAVVASGLRSEQEMRRRETTMWAAERVMAASTLLTRADLDLRIGRHDVGEFIVTIQRPEPTLYRIALSERVQPEQELLVTVVYRETP